MSTKVKTTNITNTGSLQQMARQINENFGRVCRAINTPQTVQIYYDDNHTLARVIVGQIPDSGKQIIAISKEGVDVLAALSSSPVNEDDFIFSTDIINNRTENLEKMVDLVIEISTIEKSIFNSIEGIDSSLLSQLSSAIMRLQNLRQQ